MTKRIKRTRRADYLYFNPGSRHWRRHRILFLSAPAATQAVEQFLDSMKNMDFTTMESMIQSSDLSALDNADIRNAAYTDFFSEINKKMTYKITKNRFDIQNGTASVTAHITYIDGTNIYKATITEFLRQIVSNAYAGNQLTTEETQEKLASILNEQAKKIEKDVFSEADITYR